MLSELAEYARSRGLAAMPGFKERGIKGYLLLSSEGRYIGVDVTEKGKRVYAPDIGTAVQGPRFCNPILEKAQVVLRIVSDERKDKNIPQKHDFYISMLEDGVSKVPPFGAVLAALQNDTMRTEMAKDISTHKLKGGDAVSFRVDGVALEGDASVAAWWSECRKRFEDEKKGELSRCLITGELAPALDTVPKVSGLLSVGGHTSGDAFLCHDKSAFQSYGFRKSKNAAVSEEAMTAVNAALAELVKRAPELGGAKQVHWYAGEVPEEADLLRQVNPGKGEPDPWDGWAEDADGEYDGSEAREDARNDAELRANAFFRSIREGKNPPALSARYYIMPISGAGGRMMVRGWYEGSYSLLYDRIGMWFRDLRIVLPSGRGMSRPPKMNALCIRLLKPGGDPKKVWERINNELPSLCVRLMDAVIEGTPLPDEVASRVLRWIRSELLRAEEKEGERSVLQNETFAFQLLKAWLRRKQRQRGEHDLMGESVEKSSRSVAYQCGRLLAVYGAIQQRAMPDVNVGVVERYYAAASSTPGLILGRLAKLSVHHLATLEQNAPGLAVYYRRERDAIALEIGERPIPRGLNLEEQTEFTLGYYQMRAYLLAPKKTKEDEEN